MIFSSKFQFKEKISKKIISNNLLWNPTFKEWRDIIEDYIYITRKRQDNKLVMLRIQLEILADIVSIFKTINQYKDQKEKEIEDYKKKKYNMKF